MDLFISSHYLYAVFILFILYFYFQANVYKFSFFLILFKHWAHTQYLYLISTANYYGYLIWGWMMEGGRHIFIFKNNFHIIMKSFFLLFFFAYPIPYFVCLCICVMINFLFSFLFSCHSAEVSSQFITGISVCIWPMDEGY